MERKPVEYKYIPEALALYGLEFNRRNHAVLNALIGTGKWWLDDDDGDVLEISQKVKDRDGIGFCVLDLPKIKTREEVMEKTGIRIEVAYRTDAWTARDEVLIARHMDDAIMKTERSPEEWQEWDNAMQVVSLAIKYRPRRAVLLTDRFPPKNYPAFAKNQIREKGLFWTDTLLAQYTGHTIHTD